MKNTILSLTVIAALGATFAASAFADNVATQTVTYEVSAINELEVSGPASLTVNSATAGSAPNSASDTSTTYSITTNEADRKITGSINSNMPSGVTLTVDLDAPAGATSAVAPVSLTTVAADLVTNIDAKNESDLGISYELSATSAAGVVPSASKTVTFTITAGA